MRKVFNVMLISTNTTIIVFSFYYHTVDWATWLLLGTTIAIVLAYITDLVEEEK